MTGAMTAELTLTRADDLHVHLRDGVEMQAVLRHTTERFARAVVMPNLNPPLTSTAQACAYRGRILQALPKEARFEPLMTLYLTDETDPAEVFLAKASSHIIAFKYYPAGSTTHSARGVSDPRRVDRVFGALEQAGMPLLVHGEVVDPAVDVFDREQVFIERVLSDLLRRFPGLKLVFEHISTRTAVEFVRNGPPTLAATITAHHLLLTRNALFTGGLQPHHYCLPVLKREADRQALLRAATGGEPRFFLGTDSAPHLRSAKESISGCAGIYTAHAAIELYAEVFEDAGVLERLEAFAAFHGADFYGLPRNEGTLSLVKKPWTVPHSFAFGAGELRPFRAGERCRWAVVGSGGV